MRRLLLLSAVALYGCASNRGPLTLVNDVALPGNSSRFDYQDIDAARGHLVIAHMNDGEVLVVNLSDGSVVQRFPGIPTARGVAVAPEIERILITSAPDKLVIIDAVALTEVQRTTVGNAPDGVAWDPIDRIVGVSDQRDGALSLIAEGGLGARRQIKLGQETGNVVFDSLRAHFWTTVVMAAPPDQLVEVDPISGEVKTRIELPGCLGAHGLTLHPDTQSAFVACEGNATLARIDLGTEHKVVTTGVAASPDVMRIDPGLGWLYVASEGGDVAIFDVARPGLVSLGLQHVGDSAHTVAVDPATHRLFFPLVAGTDGKPTLRIMQPPP